jgi:hypothetical protein
LDLLIAFLVLVRCHEQLLVLVSRVRTFQDLFFVGDGGPEKAREDTLDAMRAVLNRNSHYTNYIAEMLGHLNYLDRPTTSIYLSKPLRYIRHDLTADIGYVYMIVSKNKPSLGYVGETISIRRRLYEHNSLQGGSAQTHAGQPWLPAVLIKGFGAPADDPEKWQEINKANRKVFEGCWRDLNSRFPTWNSVQMMENGRLALRLLEKQFPNLDWLQLLELNENGEEQQTFPGNA